MLPREVIRQIRRLHLKARRAVEDLLGGEYHSVFKGAGIAFEDVRAYQPGDGAAADVHLHAGWRRATDRALLRDDAAPRLGSSRVRAVRADDSGRG